ncbi:[NiFe]-hydrogenase assembly chaperone HybE [Acetobacter lambici]|uniref:[NiFe]-hydrogenase assembly chaperone HybE n=1 Tax=Acetobacter lambici TaxID=1332824 RepID=A0ABT1F0S9_9PROT|nr:[NiFe]-hydrogenase assembly chaperone HybE [Acetobacter lambici]MCP1242695.1 [NiFe]-hydrogenase assembly chaperone HybE [Acetobacter lambici]MCP1258816.1 [NiFe]-hydrogenase assembly chaperone HybE [Acetobacter lambici]NHO57125.1 [NiFe]-hydrogenase assembly chaperone HybE [Acetobacter lambici]
MSSHTPRFEGSYLGDATRLPDDAIMECKICWSVYDPAEGCVVWQVPPHTPFASLPDYWRCPTCDGAKDQFMVVSASTMPSAVGAEVPATPATPLHRDGAHSMEQSPASRFAQTLEGVFADIYASKMRGLPFVNEALNVKAVGFCTFEEQLVGALLTPWFMNLIVVPSVGADWSGVVSGSKKLLDFPSGSYEFTAALRDGGAEALPGYWACSLFSPVFNFTTMLQATDTAQAAVRGLLDPALNPQPVAVQAEQPTPEPAMGRRSLLVGPSARQAGV